MDISVWLRREAAILPPNRALISDAPIRRTTALQCVIGRVTIINPRVEQRNMSIIPTRSRAKRPNKVARLQVLPRDLRTNINEPDGRLAWRRGVHRHGNETRAVGAVSGARWVGVCG